jgi:Zn-dependent peptidase ImmA (M78 family)
VPRDYAQAETLAQRVRRTYGYGDELVDIGELTERAGVIWFSLDLGATNDGACVELQTAQDERLGVAVINGAAEPGRRRWTLAHELGHFIVGDAYLSDHPTGDVERQINAFVAHLLMPRSAVERLWREHADEGPRRVALALAARYRASWSAACSQLRNLDLINQSTRDQLAGSKPSQGDYLTAGERWVEELTSPSVASEFVRQVLAGYSAGHLSAARTLDILRGTLGHDDLPSRRHDDSHEWTPLPLP